MSVNKTILITGATSGFGKAIATRFAKEGFTVCITGRRGERLNELQKELELQYKVNVIPLTFDVRKKEQVDAAIEQLMTKVSTIDILVNNAGLASGLATIDEGNVDDWELMIDTNLKGLLYVSKKVIPIMKNQLSGHIFNIGSTAGKMVYKNGNVYCATKYGVDAITQAMRIELLQYSIKVTAINPGISETEFSLVRFKGDADRAKGVYAGVRPLQADDIANVAWFCASLPDHVCINDLTITCLTQANSVYNIKEAERLTK